MLSRLSVRGAHTATKSVPAPVEKTTKIASGLTVATIDAQGPLSQLVLAFRAGSRFEKADQAGLVHTLRNYVGRDTTNYPGVSVVWSSAVAGANLKSFTTRDVFGVSMTVPRDETATALSILGHAAAQPAFKPWDKEDVIPTMKADNGYRSPYVFAFEGIHRAAYRNGGLANSVYSPCSRIGKLSNDSLVSFANTHLVSGNGILFATNVEQEELVRYAENYSPITQGNTVAASASPYLGGEQRLAANTKFAHVIVAGEGAAGNNSKAVATQAVLLTALGNSSPVKFSTHPSGTVAKAVGGDVSVSAFQAIHSDNGLAGVYIVADANNVASSVTSVVAALRSFKITDIETIKKQALNNALRAKAHSDDYSVERASQLLVSSDNYIQQISNVTAGDVEAAAQRLVKKLSLSSYGNISQVPYVDSL